MGCDLRKYVCPECVCSAEAQTFWPGAKPNFAQVVTSRYNYYSKPESSCISEEVNIPYDAEYSNTKVSVDIEVFNGTKENAKIFSTVGDI